MLPNSSYLENVKELHRDILADPDLMALSVQVIKRLHDELITVGFSEQLAGQMMVSALNGVGIFKVV